MKYMNVLALGAVAGLSILAGSAHAEGFTSHYSVDPQPYREFVENLSTERKLNLREYLNYEEREPCQNYRPIPEGFVRNGCFLSVETQPIMDQTEQVVTSSTTTQPEPLRPVIKDYKIHFDFDKYNVRISEAATIDSVAEEIKTYEPYEVTIEGYTDRSGPADYNMALSQKRALSVSNALTAKGVPNRILDKEAYGETNPAVPTADGVKLEENRRVEIQFRK